MRAETRAARNYLLVDKIIRSFECWIQSQVRCDYLYTKESIHQRISQALAWQITNSFLKKFIGEPLKGQISDMEILPIKFSCGGVKIDKNIGSAVPKYSLLATCFFKFITLWFYILIGYFLKINRRNAPSGPVTLIYGVSEMDLQANSGNDFRRYCREASIPIIANAKNYVVQFSNTSIKSSQPNFFYFRFPLLDLFFGSRLPAKDVLVFLRFHFESFWGYIALVYHTPIACLLWRDYSEHSIASTLNSKSHIEAIIVTNSNWAQQFLWMNNLPERSYKIYLGLYSVNSSPLTYKNDNLTASHPSLRHLKVDKIWTWNDSYQFVLQQEGIFCETETVGPVIWRPTTGGKNFFKTINGLNISIFDVTPQNHVQLNKSGILKSYYSFENAKLFLDDILVSLFEMQSLFSCKVEVLLKHKRTRSGIYCQDYFKYIDSLANEAKNNLKIIKEDSNLFNLINQSSLVIVMPFSSPACIADYLNIPSLYYDPTGDLIEPSFLPIKGKFIGDKLELKNYLLHSFKSVDVK